MKRITLFFAAVIIIAKVNIVWAQPVAVSENWVLLGTRSVDYLIDHDVITFPESKDSYTAIKFIVKNGPLNMFKCTLHFRGGDTKNVEFPDDVKANDERVVDLKGSYLSIEKVTFWYDTKTKSDKKAILEVWGSM
ncbi:MAG TPA: hypothetical protein VIM65_04610 [Cyclobacteriaceae bacterium]